MTRAFALLAVAFLLAGCSAPRQEDLEGPEGAGAKLGSLRLDNCHGLDTAVEQPSALLDAGRPPGWEPSGRPTSQAALDIHECKRIMVGPFERGPVMVAFEMHNDHSTPANCTEGEYTASSILHKLWLSDPEVARWLANQSLPAEPATFAWTPNELADGLSAPTIVIGVEGAQPSEVHSSNQFSNDTRQSSTERLFWAGPDGVSFIDLHADVSYNAQYPGYFTGTFHEPFLYAQAAAGGNVAGLGGFYDHGWMEGEVHHFRGFECVEESP